MNVQARGDTRLVVRTAAATAASMAIALAFAAAIPTAVADVAAGRLFVYPAKGQTQTRLEQDRYDCHVWARQQSGFDPTSLAMTRPPQSTAPTVVPVAPNPSAGAAAKGTLAGAVVGGVIGAHNHDTAAGAVLGAVVGSLAGGTIETEGRQKVEREAREEAQRVAALGSGEQLAHDRRREDYRRAISACLEGRGYTVR